MRGMMAEATGLTLADLRSLSRWMRSVRGPIFMEWQAGSLTVEEDTFPFRRLLELLDGSDADVRKIDVYGSDLSVKEIRSLFSAYRRLRRAERRMEALCRAEDRRMADLYRARREDAPDDQQRITPTNAPRARPRKYRLRRHRGTSA